MKLSRPKVSIIVPVWNTEQYLERCLKSLVGQSMTDIEIICVNDGSSDGSLKVLKRFSKQDSRVRVFNQSNAGVATARNVGLGHATADYIMWCDSDDEYTPMMCEKMYRAIIKHRVDLVACAMNVISTNVDSKLGADVEEYVRLKFNGKQHINWNLIVHTDVSLPSKIMKKSLIDKFKIHFPAGLHFEDAFFLDQYFTASNTAYYLNEKLYNYHRNNDSIMSRSFKKTSVSLDYIQIIPKTYEYLKKNKLLAKYNDFFWHRFIQYYAFSYDNAPASRRMYVYKWGKSFINSHQEDLRETSAYIVSDLSSLVSPLRASKALSKRIAKRFIPPKLYHFAKQTLRRKR